MQPIAHAARNPDGTWREPHDLADHLFGVAGLAARHAEAMGASEWARLAGLWHDLGKYRPAFQNYIRRASGFDPEAHVEGPSRVDHSTAGAMHALNELSKAGKVGEVAGRVLAYLIAGHHAGLPDWNGTSASLYQRLQDPRNENCLREVLDQSPRVDILRGTPPSVLPNVGQAGLHLWTRMLFSCLVDADFLDTEAYMEPDKTANRAAYPDIASLQVRFAAHMARLSANASPSPVNSVRAQVVRQCIARGAEPRWGGLFTLTVPTGGGKTFSSLAFALAHAVAHRKRRVVYAIPYLSIIEQTANVFRGIFGEDVIEHHSNLDPGKETARGRLAAENWDAPLVVTTNVQLFESLFAAKTSRCRKLHNLGDSVVILDEAQLLPPEFLEPCLCAVRVLSERFGVTFVLCSATQPAFQPRQINSRRFEGLPGSREIVDDPDSLYRDLDRVRVHWPEPKVRSTWEAIAKEVERHDHALVIVNRKADARALTGLLDGALYLSTDLCGSHRSERINEIRERLIVERTRERNGDATKPLRVVSTQLIEAGVDVDFPVVFRALAGIDSIAQAAGRCNREGRLNDFGGLGEVHVFVPPKSAPPGLLLKGEQAAWELLALDPCPALTPPLFDRYFRLWFARLNSFDTKGILELLEPGRGLEIKFRTAAEEFHLIPDDGVPVIVRWGGSESLLSELRRSGPDRWLMRKLQRFSVNVRRRCLERLVAQGDVEEVLPGLYAQANDLHYDRTLGYLGASDAALAPAGFIVSNEDDDA